jgi:hypothetical protein
MLSQDIEMSELEILAFNLFHCLIIDYDLRGSDFVIPYDVGIYRL